MKTLFDKVMEATKLIPKGKVATYKDIAALIGNPNASRAVGNALKKNPFPSHIVPCHRVIRSDGNVGGYAHDTPKKIDILRSEGIIIENEKIDLKKFGARF